MVRAIPTPSWSAFLWNVWTNLLTFFQTPSSLHHTYWPRFLLKATLCWTSINISSLPAKWASAGFFHHVFFLHCLFFVKCRSSPENKMTHVFVFLSKAHSGIWNLCVALQIWSHISVESSSLSDLLIFQVSDLFPSTLISHGNHGFKKLLYCSPVSFMSKCSTQ